MKVVISCRHFTSSVVLFVLLLCLQWKLNHGLETLYSFDDPISQFVSSNFSRTISYSDTAWVVEFYAVWCGHCVRFAPTYRELATDIQKWRRLVRVGSVACSDPQNSELCRKLGIGGYPSIRVFPRGAPANHRGLTLRSTHHLWQLRKYIVEKLAWGVLTPIRTQSDIERHRQRSTEDIFVLVTNNGEENEDMAKEVILDLSERYPQIMVLHTIRGDSQLTSDPRTILHQLTTRNLLTPIRGPSTREQLVATILQLADSASTRGYITTTPTPTESWLTTPPVSTIPPSYSIPESLHMQDLESGLYYSLWLEVGGRNVISGSAVYALKKYVKSLARYFPGNDYTRNFLARASRWADTMDDSVRGTEWVRGLTQLQGSDAYVPNRVQWVGCAGSSPSLRGYPCSLWQIFHAMTVQVYLHDQSPSFNPREILDVIWGYVRHFLGCRECAGHFSNAAVNIQTEVFRRPDTVLWLWKAHNRANSFLHDDETEDPQHLKFQFPHPSACPTCRQNQAGVFDREGTEWEETQVLAYLVRFYRRENIILDAVPFVYRGPSYNGPHITPAPSMSGMAPPPGCQAEVSPWSACSVTCGVGAQYRMSNQNSECELRVESHACHLRPCSRMFLDYATEQNSHNCSYDTFWTTAARALTFGACETDPIVWTYCSLCTDRCCYPVNRVERQMDVTCNLGGQIKRAVMNWSMFERCQCSDTCPP